MFYCISLSFGALAGGFNIQKGVKWSIWSQKSKIRNISKMVRGIKKFQNTYPQNMPILRLFTLSNMVYLHNLVIWKGFQYLKGAKWLVCRVLFSIEQKCNNLVLLICHYMAKNMNSGKGIKIF